MDFRMREGFQGREGEFLGQSVDFCVAEELVAGVIHAREIRGGFEGVCGGEFFRGVFACVEVFEETT